MFPIRSTILKNRASGIRSSGSEERDLPVRRCVRRTSSGICTDSGADRVLFPVRLYSKACRNRARHHRATSDLLRMFRTGVPGTASDQVCRRAGEENERKRSQGLSGEHRMEWNRQSVFPLRIPAASTLDRVLAILTAPTKKIPYFNFEVPTELPGVDPAILDPRDTYADASEWEAKAKDLAARFIKNFKKYESNELGKGSGCCRPTGIKQISPA